MSFENVSAAVLTLLFSSLYQIVTKTAKIAGVVLAYMPVDLMSFKNVSNHTNNHLDVSVKFAGNRVEQMNSTDIAVVESPQAQTNNSWKPTLVARRPK